MDTLSGSDLDYVRETVSRISATKAFADAGYYAEVDYKGRGEYVVRLEHVAGDEHETYTREFDELDDFTQWFNGETWL